MILGRAYIGLRKKKPTAAAIARSKERARQARIKRLDNALFEEARAYAEALREVDAEVRARLAADPPRLTYLEYLAERKRNEQEQLALGKAA